MIGSLPRSLIISDVEYAINTDYRIALLIFEAFDDPDLSEREKTTVLINNAYKALKGNSFIDKIYNEVMDWEVVS